MANTIILKKGTGAENIPLAGDLTPGELAINSTDGRVFTKKESGDVVEVATTILGINTQIGSYTIVLSDRDQYIRMTSASANTVTLPLDITVDHQIGTQIHIRQAGVGATSLVATGGVTINSIGDTLNLFGQNSTVTILKVGADEWDLFGSLEVI